MGFLDELQQNDCLPGDGAMGTMLLAGGVAAGRCLEELCVSQPELVYSVHQQFMAAGARVLRTNSFGANAVRLAPHALDRRVNELNWTAARLARDAARGKPVFVAGAVGPLGIDAAQAEERRIDRKAVFQEQIGALLDGGVDLIIFETFQDCDELTLALEVKYALHHCPAICSLACPPGGLLTSGMPLSQAFKRLLDCGAEVVGVNCLDAELTVRLLGEAVPPRALVAAYPSAGLPETRDDRLVYPLTPDSFAEAAGKLKVLGARLIGGCCGTRPEHIAAMVERFSLNPGPSQ